MKNMDFDLYGRTYRRISKRMARKEYAKGSVILICPCFLRPGNGWGFGMFMDLSEKTDFDKEVQYFEYYNCTNYETGKYASFYLELKR